MGGEPSRYSPWLAHCGSNTPARSGTSRAAANAREAIVRDDADRVRFVDTLGRVAPVVGWRVHAWVLMTNHHHLLVETPEPTLARGMRQLNGVYSQAFNRRHGRVGHVFQGRYKAILIERESHLLELVRYVVLNPVRAGMVRTPADYRWSSYASTGGLVRPPEWLEVNWTLAQFGRSRSTARRRFREFVADGRGSGYRPWEELRGRVALGGDSFMGSLADRVEAGAVSPEVPRRQRQLRSRPSCRAVLGEVRRAFGGSASDMAVGSRHAARKAFALLARRLRDASLAEIADELGLSTRSASSVIRAAEARERADPAFRLAVVDCTRRLRRLDRKGHRSET